MASNLTMQVILQALDKITAPFQQAAKSSEKLSTALGKSQGELKRLQDAQKNLKAFDQLRVQAAQSNSAIRENQQRLAAVTREINQSTAPTKALLRERDKLTRQSAALNGKYQQERAKMAELTRQLKGVDMGTGSLSARKAALAGQIGKATQEVDKHKAALERLNTQQQRTRELSEYGGKLKQGGQVMAMHGAGAVATGGAGLRGMYQLAGEGMEFDATMSKVQSLARLDKGGADMQMLRDQAKQLGAETMFSATDAARGQAFLAMAGFTPQSIQAAMPGLLDMALAGDMDLGQTADIASNILGGFKLDASEMGRVSDILTKAFTTSNTSLESLGETMKYVGPVAAAAGMELEEAAAMAGLLGNVGIQGSQAGTTLRTMMLNLAGPAKKGKKAMEALGVATADAQGNMREVPDILLDIAKMTESMGTAERMAYLTDIFGKEPAAGVAELISQAGSKGIEEYIKNVRDNAGAASATAKTMADNLVGDLDELSSAWSGLKIDVFEGQSDGLRSLTQTLTGVVGKVAIWAKENPELVASIAKWGAIILGVVTALGALALTLGTAMMAMGGLIKMYVMVASSMGAATKAISLLGKAFLTLGKFMLANPMFAAIALLAGAAYMVYRNWDDMVGGFKQMWSDFTGWWSAKTAVLGQDWAYLKGAISAHWADMVGGAKQLWSDLGDFFSGLWASITGVFSGGIGSISAFILNWSPLGLFYQIMQPVFDWFGLDLPAKFSEFGANIISGLVDGIKGMASSAKEAITGVGSNVTGWFKDKLGIHSPSRVFAELGGHTVDGLAVGIEAQEDGPLKRITELGKKLTAAAGLSIPLLAGQPAAALEQQVVEPLQLPELVQHVGLQQQTPGLLQLPELVQRIGLQRIIDQPLRFDSRVPLQSGPRQTAAPNQTSNITINIHAAPGMDERALAKLVQQELEKAQRQQQVRQRSRFGDLD